MEWLRKALETVYGTDGLVGVVVVVLLMLVAVYLFGANVLVMFGGG